MKRARTRAGCSCVSDVIALHIYNDDHGPIHVWCVDATGKEFEAIARIRTAKIRCLRCGFINLQKIPAP